MFMIYVLWSSASPEEAAKIARALLDQRLIACGSILPEVTSIYRWNGVIETATEVKVIFKTREKHFEAIRKYIEENCSYETPEIVSILIGTVSPKYLKWLIKET